MCRLYYFVISGKLCRKFKHSGNLWLELKPVCNWRIQEL
jgi:hypothetical protein